MRGPRSLKDHARRPGRRTAPLILIVSEGKETEPRYFNALRTIWRLSGVKVKPSPSSAPIRVVEAAIRFRDDAKRTSPRSSFQEPFDEVWAVFDQDQHSTVAEAKSLAEQNGIKVAFSKPSFELWLLLHFVLSLKPLINSDEAEAELKLKFPAYSKSGDLTALVPNVGTAIKHGELLLEKLKEPGMANYPFTTVQTLVNGLQDLRRDF